LPPPDPLRRVANCPAALFEHRVEADTGLQVRLLPQQALEESQRPLVLGIGVRVASIQASIASSYWLWRK